MLKFRLSEFVDKLILLVAMLVFVGLGLSGIVSTRDLETISEHQRAMLSEQKVDVHLYDVASPVSDKTSWGAPSSQARGDKWIFDVFTPPVIYYDPVSREFAITPPNIVAKVETPDSFKSFGLELIEVKPRPYRLQLIGYAGEAGNYMASFEYMPSGEMILAKPGKLLAQAGAKIVSFEVKQMLVEQEGSMPVYDNVGIALLKDFESGEEIYLTNLETKLYSDLEAKVRSIEDGQVYLVREGSRVDQKNSYYVIGDLSDSPPEAMVTRISRREDRRQSKLLTPLNRNNSQNNVQEEDRVSPFAIRPKVIQQRPRG